jgi:hypothetical protein
MGHPPLRAGEPFEQSPTEQPSDRAKRGTTLRLTLSIPASVRFAVAWLITGRKVSGDLPSAITEQPWQAEMRRARSIAGRARDHGCRFGASNLAAEAVAGTNGDALTAEGS